MTPRSIAIAMLLVTGCAKDEAYARSSETVTAPSGSPWRSAMATIRYEPGRYGAHASTSAQVVLSLHLDGDAGAKDVELDTFLEGGDAAGDTPKKVYERLKDPAFALAFAPDGRALRLSVDGGETYRLVAFESDAPFYCAHATWDGEWAGAPSVRELVLEILASADPPVGDGRLHLEPGEHPRGRYRFQTELEVAREHACASLDDAELRRALLRALVLPGDQLEGSSTLEDAHIECATRAIAEHPADQGLLVPALRDPVPNRRARAARALVDGGDATARDAIAAALREMPASCDEQEVSCIDHHVVQASLAWSLAKMSTRLGASPATREALVAASRSTHAVTRVHSTRGLAIDPDEPALERLRELAKEPCDTPLPAIDEPIGPFDRLYPQPHAAPCWARAALGR